MKNTRIITVSVRVTYNKLDWVIFMKIGKVNLRKLWCWWKFNIILEQQNLWDKNIQFSKSLWYYICCKTSDTFKYISFYNRKKKLFLYKKGKISCLSPHRVNIISTSFALFCNGKRQPSQIGVFHIAAHRQSHGCSRALKGDKGDSYYSHKSCNYINSVEKWLQADTHYTMQPVWQLKSGQS